MPRRRVMRRVGWAYGPGVGNRLSTPHGVYEALGPLECAACRRAIATGERLTRRHVAGANAPVCPDSAPIDQP
jgi:hypothetical protein